MHACATYVEVGQTGGGKCVHLERVTPGPTNQLCFDLTHAIAPDRYLKR